MLKSQLHYEQIEKDRQHDIRLSENPELSASHVWARYSTAGLMDADRRSRVARA